MERNLRCIAIDDEPMALLIIEQFCRRKGGMELSVFSEPQVGLEEIRMVEPELVFLDIQMNSINGLEIANSLPEKCCFIFTTAYAQYALEGFNLDAVDFLHKPFSYERFEIAVEKAIRRIESKRSVSPEYLIVKQEYNNVNIPLSDILYIEAMGNYVKIFRKSGGHILTRTNLKNITDMLPERDFLRIHRSYVISLTSVVSFSRTRVELRGLDESLPVGTQFVTKVIDALSK